MFDNNRIDYYYDYSLFFYFEIKIKKYKFFLVFLFKRSK